MPRYERVSEKISRGLLMTDEEKDIRAADVLARLSRGELQRDIAKVWDVEQSTVSKIARVGRSRDVEPKELLRGE